VTTRQEGRRSTTVSGPTRVRRAVRLWPRSAPRRGEQSGTSPTFLRIARGLCGCASGRRDPRPAGRGERRPAPPGGGARGPTAGSLRLTACRCRWRIHSRVLSIRDCRTWQNGRGLARFFCRTGTRPILLCRGGGREA